MSVTWVLVSTTRTSGTITNFFNSAPQRTRGEHSYDDYDDYDDYGDYDDYDVFEDIGFDPDV